MSFPEVLRIFLDFFMLLELTTYDLRAINKSANGHLSPNGWNKAKPFY